MKAPICETYGNDTLRSILGSVEDMRGLLEVDDPAHTLGVWQALESLEKDIKQTLWVRSGEDK